jgi:Terminase RNaseH-like domain
MFLSSGTRLIELYRQVGLNISPADNAVEAGIYACDQLMHAGKLKVFNSLSNFYSKLRDYRRDKDGKVAKERDHYVGTGPHGHKATACL